jgi:hypothetical protein
MSKTYPPHCLPEDIPSGCQTQGPTRPRGDTAPKHSTKPHTSNTHTHTSPDSSRNLNTQSAPALPSYTITGTQHPQLETWLKQDRKAEPWHHPEAIHHHVDMVRRSTIPSTSTGQRLEATQGHGALGRRSAMPSTTSADAGNTHRRLERSSTGLSSGTQHSTRSVQGLPGDRVGSTRISDHSRSARHKEDLVGLGHWAEAEQGRWE